MIASLRFWSPVPRGPGPHRLIMRSTFWLAKYHLFLKKDVIGIRTDFVMLLTKTFTFSFPSLAPGSSCISSSITMNSPFIKGSSWSSTSGRGNSNFCLTRSSACGHRHVRSTLSSLAQVISFPPLHFGWVPSQPSCATRCRSESLWLGKQQPCLRKRKLGLDTTHNVFILQKAILFT